MAVWQQVKYVILVPFSGAIGEYLRQDTIDIDLLTAVSHLILPDVAGFCVAIRPNRRRPSFPQQHFTPHHLRKKNHHVPLPFHPSSLPGLLPKPFSPLPRPRHPRQQLVAPATPAPPRPATPILPSPTLPRPPRAARAPLRAPNRTNHLPRPIPAPQHRAPSTYASPRILLIPRRGDAATTPRG